ncbi:hypothetical protein H8957_012744 [Semnopithecus entellus]
MDIDKTDGHLPYSLMGVRTRQQALSSRAGLRLLLGLGLRTPRPRPPSQVSLELWALAAPRAPEGPGDRPAPSRPSATAPVRRPAGCHVSRSQDFLGARAGGGGEEFCPDSAAVGSRQAFSWVSPGKVAKLFFTCKNMLFIFQSLLVNLEIADSPAQVQSPQTLF